MSTTAMTDAPGVIDAGENDGDQLQLVTFEVANEEFAVDILSVQEINRMMELTRVPQSPPEVEGVINLRGRIIPVIDLRRRFGLEEKQADEHSRIVVVEITGRVIGFIVDRVHEVLRIDSSVVEAPPSMITTVKSDYIAGVGKLDDRLLIMLDLGRLFNAEFMQAAEQVAAQAGG